MLKRTNTVFGVVLALLGLTSRIMDATQQPSDFQGPSPENKKLAVFVGTWKDEAELKPGPLGPGGRMSLTETCEWFSGGFSVVCNTETLARTANLKTLTVLTYDAEDKVYRIFEFNSAGWNNSAQGTVSGDTWTFESESKVDGRLLKTRSTIKLTSLDSATMNSEASVDGGPWTPLMELRGIREKQSLTDPNPCVPHASEGWPFELFECYRGMSSSH